MEAMTSRGQFGDCAHEHGGLLLVVSEVDPDRASQCSSKLALCHPLVAPQGQGEEAAQQQQGQGHPPHRARSLKQCGVSSTGKAM